MMPPPPPPPPPIYDPNRMEANGRRQKPPASSTFLLFMNVLNASTHLLLGAVIFSAFSYATAARETVVIGNWVIGWPASHSQHIYLCVTGYILLMSQAFLVYNPYVGWASNLLRPQKRMVHVIMQICGATLAIAGSIIKMTDRVGSLDSAHAIIGFIAMLLAILNLTSGIVSFVCSWRSEKTTLLELLHTCISGLTITVAFIALVIAFHNYYRDVTDQATTNLSISITVMALLGILTLVFVKLFKRK